MGMEYVFDNIDLTVTTHQENLVRNPFNIKNGNILVSNWLDNDSGSGRINLVPV
jgi:hypothetical protein